MRILITVIIVLGSMMLFRACSTVINTTTQSIELKTNPANAKILIDGKKFGTSPQVVNIERGANHVVKFELDGYDVYETQLTRKISYLYWLNALNGFIPGMVTDWFTGSMYSLIPNEIEIELTPARLEETKKKR